MSPKRQRGKKRDRDRNAARARDGNGRGTAAAKAAEPAAAEQKAGEGQFEIAADDEADLRPVNLAVAKKLFPFLRPHRGILALGLAIVLVRTGIALMGPRLQGQVVGEITHAYPELAVEQARALRLDRVLHVSGLLLAVQLALFFVSWIQNYILARAGQDVLFDLRGTLFRHVEGRAAEFFQRWPVGRLVSRVANDVEAISELFTSGLIAIVGDLFTIVGVIAVLLVWDWKLAVAGLCSLPLIIAIVAGFRRPVRTSHRNNRRRMAKLAAFLNERITGVRVIRAFAAEAEDRTRFDAVNQEVYASYRRSIHLDGLFNPGVYGASSLAIAALLWVGGVDLQETHRIDAEKLFAFIMYVQWFYMPIRDIAEKYTLIQKAMASSERIVELLEVPDGVPDPSPAEAVPLPQPLRGDLALDRVTFRYVEGAPPALDDVSLHVAPGETLAIVGATGAGKSTIANLVSRFWDPASGAVRLDGIDLRKLRKQELRQRVALVLQDVFLFAGTIEENIALKPGPLSPEERANVEAAAKAVAAHEVIQRLGGYQAVVEERGATLSQGERQLISFARALAQKPSVLLLDEATASLDPDTEARLQAGVRALTAGRTAIVIAHRLATVREATRIAVLHQGKLRELGSHEELVRQGGLYARLVELQMGAEEPAHSGSEGSRARSDRVPQA